MSFKVPPAALVAVFKVTKCLPCLLKNAVSADDVLPYVPSRLSRDKHHLVPAGNYHLGKPMRQTLEQAIRIDVFLWHKSLVQLAILKK